jgi:hypothetical protein
VGGVAVPEVCVVVSAGGAAVSAGCAEVSDGCAGVLFAGADLRRRAGWFVAAAVAVVGVIVFWYCRASEALMDRIVMIGSRNASVVRTSKSPLLPQTRSSRLLA